MELALILAGLAALALGVIVLQTKPRRRRRRGSASDDDWEISAVVVEADAARTTGGSAPAKGDTTGKSRRSFWDDFADDADGGDAD